MTDAHKLAAHTILELCIYCSRHMSREELRLRDQIYDPRVAARMFEKTIAAVVPGLNADTALMLGQLFAKGPEFADELFDNLAAKMREGSFDFGAGDE